MHSTGRLYSEELKSFKKSLVVSPSDLAYQLDELSLLVGDENYFSPAFLEKGQLLSDDLDSRVKSQNINKYFALHYCQTMLSDVRSNLK